MICKYQCSRFAWRRAEQQFIE